MVGDGYHPIAAQCESKPIAGDRTWSAESPTTWAYRLRHTLSFVLYQFSHSNIWWDMFLVYRDMVITEWNVVPIAHLLQSFKSNQIVCWQGHYPIQNSATKTINFCAPHQSAAAERSISNMFFRASQNSASLLKSLFVGQGWQKWSRDRCRDRRYGSFTSHCAVVTTSVSSRSVCCHSHTGYRMFCRSNWIYRTGKGKLIGPRTCPAFLPVDITAIKCSNIKIVLAHKTTCSISLIFSIFLPQNHHALYQSKCLKQPSP